MRVLLHGGVVACLCVALVCPVTVQAQGNARRLTTVDALRQFPGFYHLQNVLVRGEFAESGNRTVLRSDTGEIRIQLGDSVRTTGGPVEVRAQLVDVGRLETDDPRAGENRDKDRWPRPGEELYLQVTNVTDAQTTTTATVRAIALEPWKYAGKQVTVIGNFRGRNLFGDQPGAPGLGRYDFVLRGTEGALWVTGQQPKGRGFDLDVNRRIDTDRWLEVTGTVSYERGLVMITATRLGITKPLSVVSVAEEKLPAPPPPAVEVVFTSPSDGETDVSPASSVRIQFSRGLNANLIKTGFKVTYQGAPANAEGAAAGPSFQAIYDAANRAVELKFGPPLEPFRTVTVETLDTLKGFDGGEVSRWTMTFSVGS